MSCSGDNEALHAYCLSCEWSFGTTSVPFNRLFGQRWATKMHKDVADESFWGTVDKTMEGMRSKLVDETAITKWVT